MNLRLACPLAAVALTALVLSPTRLCAQAHQKPAASEQNKVPGGVYEPVYPAATNDYPLGPDSKTQPGVPAGKTFKFVLDDSKIFPNTTRNITVYVPAQYSPDKPACLWIELDNMRADMHFVFDNLIARHEMPVTIAIAVAPGSVASSDRQENPRLQRSLEFDALSGRLAGFIVQEVIPEVERHATPDGKPIHISRDPNDHAISGGSTGGIAAFNAAFFRPDYFHRVYTIIGTFVGMRGGEQEYVQVRKTEPQPIRIFMNDGANDEWPGGPEMGDWHMSNLTMERALAFAGYDVKHVWGDGTHNGAQGEQLLPDAMRWLWRDYPKPIVAASPGNPRLATVLTPGQGWMPTTSVPPGSLSSPAGRDAQKRVEEHFGSGLRGVALRSNGDVYVTVQSQNGGELWRIQPDGHQILLDHNITGASGLAFSPDGLWLIVAQSDGQHGLDYRVRADGSVDSREAMYQFYVPLTAENCGAGQLAFDTQGWLYAATTLGVQIFDRNGRVIGILPAPEDAAITELQFTGPEFKTLLIRTAVGKLYQRPMQVAGYPPTSPPIQMPRPTSGTLLLPGSAFPSATQTLAAMQPLRIQ